jgi:hypothetical protein
VELVKLIRCAPEDYLESGNAARNRVKGAETMLGVRQLDNMQACIADVLRDGVPGDRLEAGVWRGGLMILMRAALTAFGETSRTVGLADSFAGLPEPDHQQNSFDSRRRYGGRLRANPHQGARHFVTSFVCRRTRSMQQLAWIRAGLYPRPRPHPKGVR